MTEGRFTCVVSTRAAAAEQGVEEALLVATGVGFCSRRGDCLLDR
jgi:hypothetical protein